MKSYLIALGRLFNPEFTNNESLYSVYTFFIIFIVAFFIAIYG